MAYIDYVTKVLNIQPEAAPTRVRLSQYENGRTLYFTLVGNENPIPNNVTVTISGTKPDGTVYSGTGSISNGDTVLIQETLQMTAAAGPWDAKVKLTSGGNTVATGRIRFLIDADTVEPGSVPSDSTLEGLVEQAQQYAETARQEAYGSPLTASTVAGMTDHTRVYVYTGSETGYTFGNWYYWNGTAWTSGGVYNSTAVQTDKNLVLSDVAADGKAVGDAIAAVTIPTDKTLTISDAPADAKVVGDELADVKSDLNRTEDEIIRTAGIVEEMECGLTDDVKTALLACFENVAWIGADGQIYYDALENALNHSRVISSISAVFAQGSTVIYDTDELYALKQYLTVTATYNDGTTKEVNNYTLSGNLVAGTSTITVAYNKKTTTFNVSVTHQEKTLESISATFNSSASITTDNTLEDLRPYLTVRATYSDASIQTVTNYTLSGSLNVGANTITVTYNNKTATFTVNVTEAQAVLQSISASFNQGSTVIYEDNTLNDLKPYLTVTARYSDGTTQTVTGYTLSGTLTAGISTITASYGGKTDTFTVNVTASPSEKELSYLRATFEPGTNKIYESKGLDQLKPYLTVAAHYSDESSATVTNYTLSGDLIGGQTVAIAVNYTEGGITKQTSFAVTPEIIMYDWDFTTSMVDTCANKQPELHYGETAITRDSNGLNFTAPVQIVTLIDGDDDINHLDMTIEIDVASFDFKGDSTKHVRFFMDQRGDGSNSVGTGPLIFRANYGWTSYGYSDAEHTEAGYRKWSDTGWSSLYNTDQINALNGKTVKIYYGADGHTRKLYLDGTLIGTMTDVYFYKPTLRLRLGGGATYAQSSGDQCYDMTISGVRIYRGEV